MRHLQMLFTITALCAALTVSTALGQGQAAKTFNAAKGGTLDLSLNSGDIQIDPWEKDQVSISTGDAENEGLQDLDITQDGATIRVTTRTGEASSYKFAVPSHFNVKVRTSGGNIAVTGKLTGTIEGSTAAGDIRLADLDGTAKMRTSGGDIQAGTVQGDVKFNTSGGDIQLTSVGGSMDVVTSGGDIRIGNVRKTARASTSGGNIVIGEVGGEAQASTAGGSIQVGKVSGKATLTTAGGNLDLRGGNGFIKAATSGGNIALDDISGSVEATTAGGDIRAALDPSGKGKSRLTSAAGTLTLVLPPSAHATIEARITLQEHRQGRQEEFSIQSDFPASGNSRTEHEVTGRYILNGGGETITLETVDSNILIRKR